MSREEYIHLRRQLLRESTVTHTTMVKGKKTSTVLCLSRDGIAQCASHLGGKCTNECLATPLPGEVPAGEWVSFGDKEIETKLLDIRKRLYRKGECGFYLRGKKGQTVTLKFIENVLNVNWPFRGNTFAPSPFFAELLHLTGSPLGSLPTDGRPDTDAPEPRAVVTEVAAPDNASVVSFIPPLPAAPVVEAPPPSTPAPTPAPPAPASRPRGRPRKVPVGDAPPAYSFSTGPSEEEQEASRVVEEAQSVLTREVDELATLKAAMEAKTLAVQRAAFHLDVVSKRRDEVVGEAVKRRTATPPVSSAVPLPSAASVPLPSAASVPLPSAASVPLPSAAPATPPVSTAASAKKTPSLAEKEAMAFFEAQKIVYIHDKRGIIPSNPDARVDFHLPELNLVIELDDKSHFSASKHTDRAKDVHFFNQRVHCARIPTCTRDDHDALVSYLQLALIQARKKERLLSAASTDYYTTKTALPSVPWPDKNQILAA